MYQYTEDNHHLQALLNDQYVPDIKYPAEIKLESDNDCSYYSMGFDFPSLKLSVQNHVSPILSNTIGSSCTITPAMYTNLTSTNFVGNPFETSDGECSPKSIDENYLLDSILGNPSSAGVKELRTINKKPRRSITKSTNSNTKHGNRGCGKVQNRKERKSSSDSFIMPKEKDRAKLFNEAFDGLRKRIPSIPASKKLSKIEILRLAICYMSYLKFRLEDVPIFATANDIERKYQQDKSAIQPERFCSTESMNPLVSPSTPSTSSINDSSIKQKAQIKESIKMNQDHF